MIHIWVTSLFVVINSSYLSWYTYNPWESFICSSLDPSDLLVWCLFVSISAVSKPSNTKLMTKTEEWKVIQLFLIFFFPFASGFLSLCVHMAFLVLSSVPHPEGCLFVLIKTHRFFFLAPQRHKVLPQVTTWRMNPGNIMQSRGQTQKAASCVCAPKVEVPVAQLRGYTKRVDLCAFNGELCALRI